MMNLNVKAFALTCGIMWGVGLFLLTWWMIVTGGITHEKTLIGEVYLGYTVSPFGSLVGFIWASVDGIILGAIFAWLYNRIASPNVKPKAE